MPSGSEFYTGLTKRLRFLNPNVIGGDGEQMSNKRIIIFGRDASDIDRLTRILEGAGYIVSSTSNDGVAIDMAGSSYCDALLISRGVAEADRRYVATESRNRDSGLLVLTVNSHRSVLTQLAQSLP